ncbi:unnamed protein product [Bursaphelenchus okinawaensis]|uniref:DNA replication licensing factor MCM4 n=1 Tax=Bursaphelenchus okinawaensis TaxID=465554 RepID=A0A811JW90_9BILA|nr:unnamed protein product [Bursaphelenchus okinawaensis]CAG9085215.1 unnamed protein product [Bursaphelenchus okinawaensis]
MSDNNSVRAPSPTPSDASALNYGSEFGGSMVSAFSHASQNTNRSQGRNGQRVRADLAGLANSNHRTIRVDQVDDVLNMEVDENQAPGQKMYIWGTRIAVDVVQAQFKEFINSFTAAQVDEDETTAIGEDGKRTEMNLNEPYYIQRLAEISISEVPVLNLNLGHVKQFKESLYKMIVSYPADVIPYLDMVVNELFESLHRKLLLPIEVRPFNAEQTKNLRDLNPEDIEQLITTSGMVVRISPLIPEMRGAYFKCSICNFPTECDVDRGRIEEPTTCTNCSNSMCFQIIHNLSVFLDKQVVKLQEIPGDENTGHTQHTVNLVVHGALVENVHPGDRVSVTGIFRGNFNKVHPAKNALNAILATSIDVLHFRKMNQNRLHDVNDGSYLTEERIQEILKLSKEPDVIHKLCGAIAPQIFGHEDVKQGLLCQLFGGTRKPTKENENRSKLRAEINVLLCGDPGTAKSQLLQYIYRLMPRSQYTSGKGSSAVGLTASIAREPETKGVVLQTGALVMADNGVCCIDEFDKMTDSTRSILHEVMEQQTLSIAKAGIICQLNARTSILAAANPIGSKWDQKKTIIENINLPHTLLSRFDLIYLIIDPKTEEYDRRLAQHLVNFYVKNEEQEEVQATVDIGLLRDYIAYAKEHINPKISEKADQALLQYYLEMREAGKRAGHITAYARQLESLIRLAEATAKMRLSEWVSKEDVDEAYKLYMNALRQSAVDPDTGYVDVSILATGVAESTRQHAAALSEKIIKLFSAKNLHQMSVSKLLTEVRNDDTTIDKHVFNEALQLLTKEQKINRAGDKITLVA